MKLTSPCWYSVTFFERCRAAATNPIRSNSAANCAGSGPVYSTNSNPSVPIGLSHRSRAADSGIATSSTPAFDVVAGHDPAKGAPPRRTPSSSYELDRLLRMQSMRGGGRARTIAKRLDFPEPIASDFLDFPTPNYVRPEE